MASNYPGSLDSFDTIASDKKTSDAVGGRTHRQMHNDLGDAVEAVQAELGTDPAGTFATIKARLDALVAYAAKTSAYTATVADHTLNVTSGTFTLDLPAASTCTGQSLKVKNSGTGVVTLDGNSSETVEGVATFPLGKGSFIEITSTGSAWIQTGGTPDTGWRDVSSSFTVGYTSGAAFLRRVGSTVQVRTSSDLTPTLTNNDWNTVLSLPAGFRPAVNVDPVAWNAGFAGDMRRAYVSTAGDVRLMGAGATVASMTLHATFTTADSWPTSLPGSAA